MTRRLAPFALVVALATVLVAGCTPSAQSPQQTARSGSSAGTTGSALDALGRMPAEVKRSEIASNFPIEVPVPAGKVTRGQAQSASAWDYELVIPVDVETAAQWYLQSLGRVEWQLVGDSSATGGTRRLRFQKMGAQSEVVLAPDGDGGTIAVVTLGVGTPVLQTQ